MTTPPPADLWPELGPLCPATRRNCRCNLPAGHDPEQHWCGWCGEPFTTEET